MLRVGLTGGLGSGKSTVASFLRELGAHVIEADEMGRAMMEPGQPVFAAIVEHFGAEVVDASGRLNRPRLAALAFQNGRIDELNAIVHPAVIAAQRQWMQDIFAKDPAAVAVVESALIFEVERDARARGESGDVLAEWRRRFDCIVAVTAPEEIKIARYARRRTDLDLATAEADAQRRMAHQIPDAEKAMRADYVLGNSGDRDELRAKVAHLWARLQAESNKSPEPGSLK
jgi:dephospho-CoA kinase